MYYTSQVTKEKLILEHIKALSILNSRNVISLHSIGYQSRINVLTNNVLYQIQDIAQLSFSSKHITSALTAVFHNCAISVNYLVHKKLMEVIDKINFESFTSILI